MHCDNAQNIYYIIFYCIILYYIELYYIVLHYYENNQRMLSSTPTMTQFDLFQLFNVILPELLLFESFNIIL